MDQKTLAGKKEVFEAAKFNVEKESYFERTQQIESDGIDRGYQRQLQDLKVLVDAKLITQAAYNQQAAALDQNEAPLDQIKLAQSTQAEIEKAGITSAKAVREAYQQGFQEIKQTAAGLLETLFTKARAIRQTICGRRLKRPSCDRSSIRCPITSRPGFTR